jgi:P-type conjugative transfer protein TrbG
MRRALGAVAALVAAIASGTRAFADPILYPDGSQRYAAESREIPIVYVQAGDLIDIELQTGERINQAIISDSLRWKMTDGVSGSSIPHVFLKPVEGNLHALLTVTTSRRTYHVRLVSTSGAGQEFVGFYYPPSVATMRAREIAKAIAVAPPTPAPAWSCTTPLDAKYRIDGSTLFRPSSVCNDGAHTYVNMAGVTGNLPVLVIVGEGNQDQIGNVTFDAVHNQYVIDGVPERLALLRDSNKGQVRVNIARATR